MQCLEMKGIPAGMILSDAGFDVFLLSTHNDMSI